MSFANDKLRIQNSVFYFDSSAQFTVQPVSVVQAKGVDVVFECLYLGAVYHSWGINGTFPAENEFPSDVTRTQASSIIPATLTIPATAHYNNTVVQCEAGVRVERQVDINYTENATLIMFGKSLITFTSTYPCHSLCRNLLLQPLLFMQVMIRM